MNFSWQTIIQSKTIRRIFISAVCAVVALLVFQLGMWVGYKKGTFACQFTGPYERMFGLRDRDEGFIPGMFRQEIGGHGSVGKIVSIQMPVMVIADANTVETTVHITNDTLIRKFRDEISSKDLAVGDTVVVLGTPDAQGQIDAKLIRVMPIPLGSGAANQKIATTSSSTQTQTQTQSQP